MNKLIHSGHDPCFGFFSESINLINYYDYVYRHPLGKRASRWRRYLAFKQFQFFGICSDEWILGCAFADLKYVTAIFYYRYHLSTRQFYHYSCKRPFNINVHTDIMPDHGEWRFKEGKTSVTMRSINQTRSLNLILPQGEQLNLVLLEQNAHPLRLCTRTGINGWTYTQKNAGLPVRGNLNCSLGQFNLQSALGHHDWSAGFMRRETFWNWAALSSSYEKYGRFGLNVSAGVNETSFSENCYWLAGKRYSLGAVIFHYQREDLMAAWQLNTVDGRLKLTFTPLGSHGERVNAILLASRFKQLFGYFSGELILEDDEVLVIRNVKGMVEEHYAKW